MKKYQGIDYIEFTMKNSSYFVYNIQSLTSQFANTVVHIMLKTLSDILLFACILTIIVINYPLISTTLFLFILIVIFLYDMIFHKNVVEDGKKLNSGNTKIIQNINESMDGFKEIRILGCENFFYDNVKNTFKKISDIKINHQILNIVPRLLLEFILVFSIVLIVMYFVNLNLPTQEIIPLFTMFGIAGIRLIPLSSLLSRCLLEIRLNRDAINRLHNDYSKVSEKETKGFNQQIYFLLKFNYLIFLFSIKILKRKY